MPVIFFIIISFVSNWFQMTVTVEGIKTTKKCVQMSGVIMSSPCGLAKVKICSLIGQSFTQEFSLVMQASDSFSLGAMASVGTSIWDRECRRAELTQTSVLLEKVIKPVLVEVFSCMIVPSAFCRACLLGFKISTKCSHVWLAEGKKKACYIIQQCTFSQRKRLH